jgi:hypothetical protein
MIIRYYGLAGTLTYHSFHTAATWTFNEGERRLRRVWYRQLPEGVFLGSGTGQKCVSSPVTDDVESLPAKGRRAAAPPPAVETRHCDGCDADFRPARPWSRFCCPACRLRAHRRLAGRHEADYAAALQRTFGAAACDVRDDRARNGSQPDHPLHPAFIAKKRPRPRGSWKKPEKPDSTAAPPQATYRIDIVDRTPGFQPRSAKFSRPSTHGPRFALLSKLF